MPSLKVEFSTVRDLEKKSYRVFAYAGGAFLVGLILTVMMAPIIGVPLIAVSAVAIIVAIGWVSVLGKEASRPVFCPYCSSKNDVYVSRRSFDCDICSRPIVISEDGEATMAQQIDTEARYDRGQSG